MKTLSIKFILSTIVCTSIAAFILTSCEQIEVVTEHPLEQQNELRNHTLEKQLETLTQFEKPLNVEHSGDQKFGVNHIDFVVKSNDEEILSHFNANSVSFKFSDAPLESVEERRDENSDAETINAGNLSGFQEGQKFVQIILTGTDNAPEVGTEENLGYSIEFSDELAEFMDENNIAMVLDFGPEITDSQVNDRHTEYWMWWNNKGVVIYTYNGTLTRTYNYYATTGSTTNWFLNRTQFSYHALTAVCCLWQDKGIPEGNKWIRRVVVQIGSVSSVSGSFNYCPSGFNSCSLTDTYPDS